jgi:NitT/TauT family transport system permease protein
MARARTIDRKVATHRLRAFGAILLGLAGFLLTWQLVVWVGGYPEFILPGPLAVFERFGSAWLDGTLVQHAATTLVEVLLGFAVGAGAGLLIGGVLPRSERISLVFSPYLVAAQSTPILALAPLLALWFGTGLVSKVVICALIVFFPVAVSTTVGLRGVDRRLIELGRSLRATRRQLFTAIEVPAALPSILGGMRVGVTLAVVGAVIGEWAGAEAGLGWLLNLARGSSFDTPLLFATLLTIALLGVVLYGLMTLIERRLVGARA